MILIEEEIFYKSFVKLILFSYLVILIEEEIFNKCHLNNGNLYIAYVQQPCCALGRWWYKKKYLYKIMHICHSVAAVHS